MKISLFTPFHRRDTSLLREAYKSILGQQGVGAVVNEKSIAKNPLKNIEWEWVIIINGWAKNISYDEKYSSTTANENQEFIQMELLGEYNQRVRVFFAPNEIDNNIGALKKLACNHCTGDIYAELDYDDLLTSDCLSELNKAFMNDEVQFAYSNDAYFIPGELKNKNDIIVRYSIGTTLYAWEKEFIPYKKWLPYVFSADYGWRTRPFIYGEHHLQELMAWEPCPQAWRRVEWAPDHIRAWRATAYKELGGHNHKLCAGDDHELLMRTYIKYGKSGICHIDKCLYLYRKITGHNTSEAGSPMNDIVQEQTHKNYCNYCYQMAERWARDSGLRLLDIGGHFHKPQGYESVDKREADIVCDLNKPWPIPSNSVGVLRASHIIEHLENPVHVMNEAYRVLAPGGWLFIDVPSTDGRGAWQDPTHISFWNSNSFWYYTRADKQMYVPEIKARFQVAHMINWFPNEEFRNNNIVVTQAHLICLKPPYSKRPAGWVDWDIEKINNEYIE